MGRGKVELKRIQNSTSRQATFSKRRNGLLKKAFELSILCDPEVALLIFSHSGKVFQFASHDMDRTIARYRNEVGLPQSNNQRSRTMEFRRSEIDDLNRTIDTLEARNRHLVGNDLSMLSTKELTKLERQLKTGVERIRSKKRRIDSEHINLLKRRVKLFELDEVTVSSRAFEADACDACQRLFPDGAHLQIAGT